MATGRVREDEAEGSDKLSRKEVFRARIASALFPRPSEACDPHKVRSDLTTISMLREVVEADHEAVAVCQALAHLVPWSSSDDLARRSSEALAELVIEDLPPVAPQVCALLRQLASTAYANVLYVQIWKEAETFVRERWPTSWDEDTRARAANINIRELLGENGGPSLQDALADEWSDEDDVEAVSVEDDAEESEDEASEDNLDSDGASEISAVGSADIDAAAAALFAPLTHPRQRYQGHVNVDTVKGVGYIGDGFGERPCAMALSSCCSRSLPVASGSDCGRLFVWNSESGELLAAIRADGQVVNESVAHPTLPLLAVSGIDDEIKLLAPSTAEPSWREREPERVAEANKRNGGA